MSLIQRFAGWLRLVEGAKAVVYTVVAIVLVYTDSHDAMVTAPSTNLQASVQRFAWR
jgi:hypothetical protein